MLGKWADCGRQMVRQSVVRHHSTSIVKATTRSRSAGPALVFWTRLQTLSRATINIIGNGTRSWSVERALGLHKPVTISHGFFHFPTENSPSMAAS